MIEARIVAAHRERENAHLQLHRGETPIDQRESPLPLIERLGPGLLFAAAAVGTSHLVQATRAGAAYGLTLGLLIVAICVLKYPLFRFAADYAAATGETLVAGYARRGTGLVWVMFAVSAIEAVAAVAGVSLVTAGIATWLFAIDAADVVVTLGMLLLTAVIVGAGRYRLLESFTTLFVALFSVLTVIATIISLPALATIDGGAIGTFALSRANLSFATAVSGWMPIGNTASIMLAAWVLAKQAESGQRGLTAARFDFNLGYAISSVLALCFLVMGSAVLFGRDVSMPGGGAQCAATCTDMFAGAGGAWSRLLVAAAALAVMYSTLLAVLDGFPRMMQGFLAALGWHRQEPDRSGFLMLLTIIVTCAGAFLVFFLSSFTAFIDLVTITGFVAAPVVAWANYAAITGDNVPPAARPGSGLRRFHLAAISALLVASASFLYLRLAA